MTTRIIQEKINQDICLKAIDVSKNFAVFRKIFSGINIELNSGDSLAVTGDNGSGKTTLLRILAQNIRASSGTIDFFVGTDKINPESFYRYIGFVSPYLNLYEEFTPEEHIGMYCKIRAQEYVPALATELLKRFGIYGRRLDPIGSFSSGMKQRVKYIISLICKPQVLFFDEPMTNLDQTGMAQVSSIIPELTESGCIVIIATNSEEEKKLCGKLLSINDYKSN
ncbi:MAG: transporter-like protein [Ignavibacteria bacterium]|nr:transporter-like protein [Ignavibacteria bacterium]